MENFKFDQLIEDIYRTIGKEDPFDRETVAVRRDILNRLNQAIPSEYIEELSDFLTENGFADDDTNIKLNDFHRVFTDWMRHGFIHFLLILIESCKGLGLFRFLCN